MRLLGVVVLAVTMVLGCAAPQAEDTSAGSDESELRPDTVLTAFDILRRQTSGPRFGAYYRDGTRFEACWKNPAGAKLTPVKKAFYCALPLEFRLCNTLALLATDDAQVTVRYEAFLDCQWKVDLALGGGGEFLYDASVNRTYKQLFLRGRSGLGDFREQLLVIRNEPAYSGRSFETLALDTMTTLVQESRDLSSPGLYAMAQSFDMGIVPSRMCALVTEAVGAAAERCGGDPRAARASFVQTATAGSCDDVRGIRDALGLVGDCLPAFGWLECPALLAGDLPKQCRGQFLR